VTIIVISTLFIFVLINLALFNVLVSYNLNYIILDTKIAFKFKI
jgi:hypothetical protein